MCDPRSPRDTEQERREQARIDHAKELEERHERDNQRDGKYDSSDTSSDPGPSDAGENWDGY